MRNEIPDGWMDEASNPCFAGVSVLCVHAHVFAFNALRCAPTDRSISVLCRVATCCNEMQRDCNVVQRGALRSADFADQRVVAAARLKVFLHLRVPTTVRHSAHSALQWPYSGLSLCCAVAVLSARASRTASERARRGSCGVANAAHAADGRRQWL